METEKKNYEVLIKAFTTVLVMGAEDLDDAHSRARDETNLRGWEIDDEEARVVAESELDSVRRHANNVSEE